jgi:4-hydroxy-tetrahydrodipicolinate synthase
MILAPDTIDHQVAVWRALRERREADAERLYEGVLPSIVFIMQSIETLICYGKRVFAARAGLTVHDRAPALRPTEQGLRLVAQHAERLGAYRMLS